MNAQSTSSAIRRHLEAIGKRDSLPLLFTQTLRWGAAKEHPFPVTVGAPVGRAVTAEPVAQLGGLPVFRVDWHRDRLPNVTERRAIHRALRDTYIEHLVCYVTPDQKRAAFVWARPRESKTELRTLPYEVGGHARTTLDQLEKLAFSIEELGLYGEVPVTKVTDKLNAAFDVEAVNREFFRQYRDCFYEEVKPAVAKILRKDADAHSFTQLLLNRLMFCWFLQKKGWLGGDPEYLLTLLNRAHSQQKSAYHDYLSFLFFNVLANPEEERRKRQPGDPHASWEAPFLNGGLFERTRLDDRFEDVPRLRQIPNSVFDSVLTNLFGKYNFTVEESTALDLQVALEPELLGTIFERLVTGRHETGSYYTPKPVVEFMCHEALAAHLRSAIPVLQSAVTESLVYDHDVSGLSPADASDGVHALDAIKVCDPACGSGAYLVTMLQELVAMYRAIYSESLRDPQKDYDLKLRIIERNLYGADIDDFAINIARLRLWLSLIVDNDETNWHKVKPLPNLDFKIEVGDSLTAPDPSDVVGGGLFRHQALQSAHRLARIKGRFMRSFGAEKKELAEQVRTTEEQLQKDLADSGNPPAPPDALDWRVAFAEVFSSDSKDTDSQGGFDIVLANPPYVRADAQFKHVEDEEERQAEIEEWKEYRRSLKDGGIYETLYEKWDLYLPFLERAHQLLRPGGRMVYIISDAYNGAKYARRSHDFFVANSTVERIDFCSDIPLFDAGVKNTILRFEKAPPPAEHQPVRVRRRGESKDEFDQNYEPILTPTQAEAGAALFRGQVVTQAETFSDCVDLGWLCYVSVGMVVHADEKQSQGAFTADDLISEKRDRKHPKPYLEGKDVGRWTAQKVSYLEYGTKRAPALFRRPTFPELHEARQRILAARMCGERPAVMVDGNSLYSNHTVIVFVPWHGITGVRNRSLQKTAKYQNEAKRGHVPSGPCREDRERLSRGFSLKYVAAVMNSRFAASFIKRDRQGNLDVYPNDWKDLPIPAIPLKQQQPIVALVDAILEQFRAHACPERSRRGHPLSPAAAAKVAELEREIDERVDALYAARQPAAVGE